jgi:hypothetical protein
MMLLIRVEACHAQEEPPAMRELRHGTLHLFNHIFSIAVRISETGCGEPLA